MKKIILLLSISLTFSFSTPPNMSCNIGYFELYNSHFSGVLGASILPYSFNDYETVFSSLSYSSTVYDYLSYQASPTQTIYQYSYTIDYYNCVPEVVCDSNQTIDTSVNPHICITPPPPLCVPPYVDVSSTDIPECAIPSDIPDINSTKPDGSCEAGYARNVFGVCKLDSDGDNVPDSEDAYPDDGTKTGSESESNTPTCAVNTWNCKVCVCPAGAIKYYDLFVLPSGTVSIPVCSATNTQTFCLTSTNPDTPDYDCAEGYVPAPDYESTANCVPSQPSICPYPAHSNIGTMPFQSVVTDIFKCISLAYKYGENGNYDNYNCPDGSVACYYNLPSDSSPSDSNSTNPTTDSNTTPPTSDLNSTNTFDTTNIESKLDLISNSLSASGSINNSLEGIGRLINSTASTNHNDLQNINGTLINKLDAINKSIGSIPQSQSTDMTATNQKLDDLKLSVDSLTDPSALPPPEDDHSIEINSKTSELSSSLMSYVDSYTPVISFNQPSGVCSDLTIDMPIGGAQTIKFKEHVDKFNILSSLLYFISIFGAVVIILMSP